MQRSPRILTPEGEIIRALLAGASNPVQILKKVKIGKSTVYLNLKDLLLVKWIKQVDDKYAITETGMKVYISEVLPEDVDVSRLVGIAKIVGVSPMRLVSLGIRLIMDIVENGELPESLGYMLARYDPSALDELVSMLERREGKQAQATEVVA